MIVVVHVTTVNINGVSRCVCICEGDGSSDSSFSCICKRNCSYQIAIFQFEVYLHFVGCIIKFDIIRRTRCFFFYSIGVIYAVLRHSAVFTNACIVDIEYHFLGFIKFKGRSGIFFAYSGCTCVCFIRIVIIGNADCKFAFSVIRKLFCISQSFFKSVGIAVILVQINFNSRRSPTTIEGVVCIGDSDRSYGATFKLVVIIPTGEHIFNTVCAFFNEVRRKCCCFFG